MIKDSKARQDTGMLLSFLPTGEYYFSKGLKAFHRRDFLRAKKYLERALQLEPGEPMIACQLAILSTEMGEYDESNRLLHQILEEFDEEMMECHYFLANNYAHLGLFKDAYHHANLYKQFAPDGEFSVDTDDLIELLTFEADDLDEELYEQDDLIVKQEHARELLESGYFPKAIEVLEEVIENYPEYWSAYNNLALAYFYLGETEKADEILQDVLLKNPGNLHAICNQAVFAYYLHDEEKTLKLKYALEKINPLIAEHQFKLGATFALIGEFTLGHFWLRKLYKKGFEGDGSFYYWLSYTAFHSGHPAFAKSIWKIVLELSPDKVGHEPWNDDQPVLSGFEDHTASIFQKLDSDYMEERMFALFLIAVSSKKDQLIETLSSKHCKKLTTLEQDYLLYIKNIHQKEYDFHQVALQLYEYHQPIGVLKSGIYLLWFSIFQDVQQSLKNHQAWAAAVEYTWFKLRGEKISQTEVAEKYDLSVSTVQKYVKFVNNSLR
ncbi:tetratricopeptide repeat protein [Bacillus sp. CGMCC 1.16607]|uniref:tetratricopeptide repeat protein n=1 Tax=Bacillus sp. CGMCC 1.16607 TaxID=3351842 RepID=UPI00363D9F0C